MNILIVGLGSIGRKHLQALQDLGVDADVFALRSGHSTDGIENVSDISALMEAPQCAFAMVCNPTHLHQRTILDLLSLNIPLFIEKPVVRHVSELKDLENITVPTYVACHLRHHPCLQYVKEHLGNRRIQHVQSYCGSYMPDWIPGSNWKKSFRADKEQSGGVHLELIHEMDYCYWLFGKPEKVESDLRNSGELGIDIIDDARYQLTYGDFPAEIQVNYVDRTPRRTLQITFGDGEWLVDILNFRIEENGKEIFRSEKTIRDVYASQMRYFLDCLQTETKPMNSVREAGEVLTLALL